MNVVNVTVPPFFFLTFKIRREGTINWNRNQNLLESQCTTQITLPSYDSCRSTSKHKCASTLVILLCRESDRLPNYLVLDPICHDLCPTIFCIPCVQENKPHFFLILSPFPSDNSLHSDEQLLAEVARRKLDLHDKITDAVVRETYDFGKVGKTNVSQLDHFLIDWDR